MLASSRKLMAAPLVRSTIVMDTANSFEFVRDWGAAMTRPLANLAPGLLFSRSMAPEVKSAGWAEFVACTALRPLPEASGLRC